jgi:hypothetical protein
MVLLTAQYRLVAMLAIILLLWLFVFVGVLPADIAVNINFTVILCALAPLSKSRRLSQHRYD